MSIGVQCPSCGRRYRVADDRQGTQMSCVCGRTVLVQGPHYLDKLCHVCGIDVSSLTRVRDPQGRYYCQPCWDEAVKAHQRALAEMRDPDVRWITGLLSRIRLRRLLRPLVILLCTALLVLSWLKPKVGQLAGASLLVIGGALLLCWTFWLYVVPFRDGPWMGLTCILSPACRRRWAKANPEFDLGRPASLALTGLWVLLLAGAFLAIWYGSRSPQF